MNTEKMQYRLPEVRVKLAEGTALYSTKPMDSPQNAVRCMADMLSELDREYLCVVNMDSALHPINYNIVSVGGINLAPLTMGNLFKTAILSNASNIMVLHNHPSGTLSPSQADIEVTRKICQASRLMDISLVDHIIVGGGSGDYCSMRESGLLISIMASCRVSEAVANYKARTEFADTKDRLSAVMKEDNPVNIREADKARIVKKSAKKHHRTS